MKTIKIIKNLAKKSPTILKTHKSLRFFKGTSLKDLLNFEKLRLILKVKPYTMVNYLRLSNVHCLSKLIEENRARGAFVECGTWKGGCAAAMARVADRAGSGRKIWLFDSFSGLPEPTEEDGMDKDGVSAKEHFGINKCIAPVEEVEKLFFSKLKLNRENIMIRKGWFEDTLPEAKKEIGPIAILRLDADWYESTKCCLENLYDNVISGGYVILDDYNFHQGCQRATDEFLASRGVSMDLVKIDDEAIYFQKP